MAIAAGCFVWAACDGFHFVVGWHDCLVPAVVILAVIVAQVTKIRPASLAAEYFLLGLISTTAFGVLSYLCMATQRPLADGALMSADRMLGFNWLAYYHWVSHHASIDWLLRSSYNSLVYQGLYFGLFFGITGKRETLREMYWMVVIAGLLTSAGAAVFPAFGPFKTYGIGAEFLPVMERLHAGNLHVVLAKMTGVVSFPSFHTTMAILYIYGFRRAGVLGWAAWFLNLLMLPAIPPLGGHYAVDMVAGAAVAFLAIAAVAAWSGKTRHAIETVQETTRNRYRSPA